MKYLILFFCFLAYTSAVFAQGEDSLVINYSYINSIPQNADVYINDEFAGNTPFRFTSGMIDTSSISVFRIKMKGYFDFVLNVDPDELPISKTITLVPQNLNTKSQEVVVENKTGYFKTPRKLAPIILSGALTTCSGIFAYYYKTRANESYDEYLQTGDGAKLDKTKKYDLYSGIGIVAFQAGLAALIYFLLVD